MKQRIATTRLELIDCEPLREEDRLVPGFYIACEGINADVRSWKGAVVYRSLDGGTVFHERLIVVRQASTTGTLIAPDTVRLLNDKSLVSVSDVAVATGNANLAIVGDAVVQFTTAELVGARDYRLSGIVPRTPFAPRVGERFVLASGALVRVSIDRRMLDREYVYIAPTFNAAYATPKRFTCRALWWNRERSHTIA